MTEPTVTRRQQALYASLDDARRRRQAGIFPAEGTKCILELLAAYRCRHLYARQQWLDDHAAALQRAAVDSVTAADGATLRLLTRLPSTPDAIAFMQIRYGDFEIDDSGITMALDRIQDPGNLGTLIRCCDWFGIRRVVASADTVDCYNPKAVQAAMGALARVEVSYGDLPELLSRSTVPVYGTFLDGDNIYRAPLSQTAVIVMGNEGRGISPAAEATVNRRLFIPPYPAEATHVESLNVGMAAAIALSQFRSR